MPLLRSGREVIADGIAAVRSQDSPEVDGACAVCERLRSAVTEIAEQCTSSAESCRAQADAIEKAHADLFKEVADFVATTAVIEGAGIAVGLLTIGIGEAAAQVGEAAEIAVTLARIRDAFEILKGASRLAVGGMRAEALDATSAALRQIIGKTPITADTTAVTSVDAAKTANAIAAGNVGKYVADSELSPGALLRYYRGSNLKRYEEFLRTKKWDPDVQVPAKRAFVTKDGEIPWETEAPKGGYQLDADGNSIKSATVPQIGQKFSRVGPNSGRFATQFVEGYPVPKEMLSTPWTNSPLNEAHTFEVTGDMSDIRGAIENLADDEVKDKILAYFGGNEIAPINEGPINPAFDGIPGTSQTEFSMAI